MEKELGSGQGSIAAKLPKKQGQIPKKTVGCICNLNSKESYLPLGDNFPL